MDFIEKRLLDKVSFGSQSGFEFKTDIKQMRNGFESRLSEWAEPLQPMNVIFRMLNPDHRQQFEDAFIVAKGRAFGFRFRNPLNYKAVMQPLAIGAGVEQTVQLKRTSRFLNTATYPIKKPVPASIVITANGTAIAAVVDAYTGLATFTAPAGSVVLWSGEYDTPVRFDSDKLIWTYDNKSYGDCGTEKEPRASTDVGLQEIRI